MKTKTNAEIEMTYIDKGNRCEHTIAAAEKAAHLKQRAITLSQAFNRDCSRSYEKKRSGL